MTTANATPKTAVNFFVKDNFFMRVWETPRKRGAISCLMLSLLPIT
ncbi:MAG: hypothetical protein HC785_20550 [Calothrix sp. CSU_2_0]|nr:hypothetical protein [Calothrix sp. CSU_2_0]